MDEQQTSPVVPLTAAPEAKIQQGPVLLSFFDALKAVLNGKKITKEEWNNEEVYGFLDVTILKLHKDGKDFDWIISEGDLIGKDWIVL